MGEAEGSSGKDICDSGVNLNFDCLSEYADNELTFGLYPM